MRIRQFRYFVGDFETTVYDGQDDTLVWASAVVELGTEDVKILHSIEETWDYIKSLNCNICIYYHNLKFDGTFWLSYFITTLNLKQATNVLNEETGEVEFLNERFMSNNTFKYSISDMGKWYNIIVKVNNHFIEFRDSLKLLPFSVAEIGNSFKTKHRKLEMEYTGFRYPGCDITDEEQKYIANDVLVVKEALEIMLAEGHKQLTIGSCCMHEYKSLVDKELYNAWFPNCVEMELNTDEHFYPNVDAWIRKSYKGGWCYLAKGKENQIKYDGTTADVNSLYPSMMSSESGNRYPIGKPTFWTGNYIPELAMADDKYYFVRIKTRFYLKKDKLPFVQIKGSFLYKGTECLETSDIYNPKDGKYYDYYTDLDGNIQPAIVEMTLTMTDFELLLDHYDLEDFEILDGCYFEALIGIYDDYIDKYKKIKMEEKGAKRQLAKLFLNNLYGKLASSTNSSFKVAYKKEDRTIGTYIVEDHSKKPVYIPAGSAITSYARNFTIRAAQANYHGPNERGFIYADTDSIHCDLLPEEVVGIKVDPVNFCCWKLESSWDKAIFVRQKTYIEHNVAEDLEPVDPYYNVKCAGMPDRCKDLFIASMEQILDKENKTDDEKEWISKLDEEQLEFIKEKRDLTDFKIGLKIVGKLQPMWIRGGTLLVEGYYTMR